MSTSRETPRLIGFTGKKRHGKDTAADQLDGWVQASFAQPIKEALEIMGFPEPEEKETTIPEVLCSWRYLAQTLGTEWGRHIVHPNIWVTIARKRISNLLESGLRVAVTDVRFPNEADVIRELGGVVVEVYRPDDCFDTPPPADDHSSENHDLNADYLLVNCHTPEHLGAQMKSLGLI